MKIEVGKTYRTRGGFKVVIQNRLPNPMESHSKEFSGICLAYGKWNFWLGDSEGFPLRGVTTDADIISEWIDKPEWCKLNPKWARFQAHDEDGDMKFFEHSTEPLEDRGEWKWDNGGNWGYMPDHLKPPLPPGCRWQDSLVEAPEGWGKDGK